MRFVTDHSTLRKTSYQNTDNPPWGGKCLEFMEFNYDEGHIGAHIAKEVLQLIVGPQWRDAVYKAPSVVLSIYVCVTC